MNQAFSGNRQSALKRATPILTKPPYAETGTPPVRPPLNRLQTGLSPAFFQKHPSKNRGFSIGAQK